MACALGTTDNVTSRRVAESCERCVAVRWLQGSCGRLAELGSIVHPTARRGVVPARALDAVEARVWLSTVASTAIDELGDAACVAAKRLYHVVGTVGAPHMGLVRSCTHGTGQRPPCAPPHRRPPIPGYNATSDLVGSVAVAGGQEAWFPCTHIECVHIGGMVSHPDRTGLAWRRDHSNVPWLVMMVRRLAIRSLLSGGARRRRGRTRRGGRALAAPRWRGRGALAEGVWIVSVRGDGPQSPPGCLLASGQWGLDCNDYL